MYGRVPLRCCDFYPVWEHFPQFKYPRLGAKWQKNHTLSGSKGSRKYTVVLSGSKNLKRAYPFGSIFAENDTRLGSKNGEHYTLSSGTYSVPKTSKCPPPPRGFQPSTRQHENGVPRWRKDPRWRAFSKSFVFGDRKHRLGVDANPKRIKKGSFSKISGHVWTGPKSIGFKSLKSWV